MKKLLPLLLILLASCSTLRQVPQPSNIQSDELVVVGKIIVTPTPTRLAPLDPTKRAEAASPDDLKSDLTVNVLWTTDKSQAEVKLSTTPFASSLLYGKIKKNGQTYLADNVSLGSTFISRAPLANRVYMNGFYLKFLSDEDAFLPSPGTIVVPPQAKAVYIGTFEVQVDEYYQVSSIQRKDDFAAANQEFQKAFPGWELAKAEFTTIGP